MGGQTAAAKRGRPRRQPLDDCVQVSVTDKETTSAEQDDQLELRRARKRATDRQSQRHHRERQRHYIKQLEEKVESYRASISNMGDVNVAAMLSEQDRLRRRCGELEATLNRIQALAGAVSRDGGKMDDGANGDGPSSDGSQTGRAKKSASLGELSPPMVASPPDDNDTLMQGQHQSVFDHSTHPEAVATSLSHDMADFVDMSTTDFTSNQAPGLVPDQDPTGSDQSIEDVDRFDEILGNEHLSRCIASIVDGTARDLDLIPSSLTMRDPLLTQLLGPSAPVDTSGSTTSSYLRFPRLSQSIGTWDKIIVSIIDEARMQHRCGLFDTSEPTLRKLLSGDCTDVVASRLYHFLCSYGQMPLHQLISIFWVQYLFLRWYVLGTMADFLRMPAFLRPTDLETRIPHRPCIAMLVWPDVRRAMIRDSHSADPEGVGITLLRHMRPDWPAHAHVSAELIGSTDVLAVIEQQARQWEFWSIDRSVVKTHPELSGCRLG